MKRKATVVFLCLIVFSVGCHKKATLQRKPTIPTFDERVRIKERERLSRWNVKSVTESYFEYADGKLDSISKKRWYAEYDRNGRKIYEETPSWSSPDAITVGSKGPFKFNSDSTWSEVLQDGMTISIEEDEFANVTEATWTYHSKIFNRDSFSRRISWKYDEHGVCTLKVKFDKSSAETIKYEFDSLMRKTDEVRTVHGLRTTVARWPYCWLYNDSLDILQTMCKESGEVYFQKKYNYTLGGITSTSWRYDVPCAETVRYDSDYQILERISDCAHWITKYEYDIDGKPEMERSFKLDSTRAPIPASLTKYSYEYFQ